MVDQVRKNTGYYLRKFDIKLKKSLGQNFLSDSSVANRIVEKTNLESAELLIEIGAGAGTLTEELLRTGKKVISFEIDRRLEPLLRDRFSEYDNLDLMIMDFNEFIPDEYVKKAKVAFVSNLPYHVSVPITVKIIKEYEGLQKACLMVQTEVAERMSALPSSKQYGSLSVFVQYYTNIKLLFNVSRSCFIPNPNVESSVVELVPRDDKPMIGADEDEFFEFVKRGFSQRRKMFKNNYREYQEEISEFFSENGISQKVRAEDISIDQFVKLYETIIINGRK